MKRIEDGIAAGARRIIDEAAPGGGGDFVELIAKRLPLQTISDMLGVPEADRERVMEAADTLIAAADPEVFGDRQPIEVLGGALWTLTEFATELAKHREQHPGDDLMTALVQAEVDGDRLTHAEIAAFLVLLSVAGNDTTRHTTSHAMRALTSTRSSARWLLEDLDARLPGAVEEFVRWATPVLTFRRTTTREVQLHGQTLPAGEKVVLFYHSGNRDERAIDRPGTSTSAGPQPPPRLRRWRPALLPGRLAGPDPAARDLRRDAAGDARHRGRRARAAAQRLHPRHQADAVHVHRARLTGRDQPAGRGSPGCGRRPAVCSKNAVTQSGSTVETSDPSRWSSSSGKPEARSSARAAAWS